MVKPISEMTLGELEAVLFDEPEKYAQAAALVLLDRLAACYAEMKADRLTIDSLMVLIDSAGITLSKGD